MKKEQVAGDGRSHLDTPLMGESLVAPQFVESTHTTEEVAMLPSVNVVGLGGRSVFDRGRKIVFPLVEAIVQARKTHELFLGVGGGERQRHVFKVGLDLGLPMGGLAQLAGASEEQNAVLLQTLLAKHGGVNLTRDHFTDLPLYLAQGSIPIGISVPPYHHWEPPVRKGRMPEHGSDLGLMMTAEALGARSMIFIKDRRGLFSDDPDLDPNATFIPHITTGTLLETPLPHLIVDKTLVETLHQTRFVTKVQIIDAAHPDNLLAALDGEPVGTIIEQGAAR